MTWLFTHKDQREEFRTKKLALAWISNEGWRRWAGKREVVIFTRGVESAGLRKVRHTEESEAEA